MYQLEVRVTSRHAFGVVAAVARVATLAGDAAPSAAVDAVGVRS